MMVTTNVFMQFGVAFPSGALIVPKNAFSGYDQGFIIIMSVNKYRGGTSDATTPSLHIVIDYDVI